MGWRIEITSAAKEDQRAIFRHVVAVHLEHLNAGKAEAAMRGRAAVQRTMAAMDRLAEVPGIGTARPDLAPNLRHVTLDGTVLWFTPLAESRTVRIEAVFSRGQDHFSRMLARIMSEGGTT